MYVRSPQHTVISSMKRDFPAPLAPIMVIGLVPSTADAALGLSDGGRDIDFIVFRLTVITPTGVSGESLNVLRTGVGIFCWMGI